MNLLKSTYFFVLCSISLSQDVSFELSYSITGEKYNLYEDIDADIGDNILYILDKGNKNIKVINLSTKETILTFGEEGNGPGKINGNEKIIVHKNRLYIYSFSKIAAFNLNGEFISQTSNALSNNYGLTIDQNDNLYRYHINDNTGLTSYIKYDLDLNELENKDYEFNTFMETNFDETNPLAKRLIKSHCTPKQIFFKDENIMYIYKGKFNIGVYNRTSNEFYNINNASFKDIAIPDDFQYRIWMRDPKKLEAARIMLTSLYRKIRNNVQDNIDEYSGSIYNYLIYRINTEKDNNMLFAILDNKKLLKTFEIKMDNSDNLSISRSKIRNSKLYVFYKNDAVGASVNIYDLRIQDQD